MLTSKKSKAHNREDTEIDEGVSISPLGIPILAGPGTIVTAMNFATNYTLLHVGIIISISGLMILFTYPAFISSDYIVKLIGNNIITVIGKSMGLILAIMGTGMIIR